MPGTKTVIISDVHLSNGATNYSWFKDGSTLKNFLQETAQRTDVKELVLLGDFFDLWLYPIDVAPWTAQQVIQQWSGADSVLSTLQECADKLPDVFYINGNHDMAVTAAELALVSPKIKFLSSDQYNITHANTLHLEHGNLVDMFNAPDISGDPVSGLPFGYFITRLVATAENHDEVWNAVTNAIMGQFNTLSLHHQFTMQQKKIGAASLSFGPWSISLDDWLESLFEDFLRTAGKWLIEAIIDVLIGYAKLYNSSINSDTSIILPDGSSVTIGEVRKHYHELLLNWYRKLGNLSLLEQSALASTNLDWCAEQLLQNGSTKLAIMGHTHAGKSMSLAGGQYVNSGCWLTDKQVTYVEIDPAASPQAVLKTYPGNTPLVSVTTLSRSAMAEDAAADVKASESKKKQKHAAQTE